MKRRLKRIWRVIENSELDISNAASHIGKHQEQLEIVADEARVVFSEHRVVLDDVETIAAYAQDMSEFLNESELTERRAFIETLVKEIVVMPGNALMHYTVPMPHDSLIPGRNAEQMPLNGSVLSTVQNGGHFRCTTTQVTRACNPVVAALVAVVGVRPSSITVVHPGNGFPVRALPLNKHEANREAEEPRQRSASQTASIDSSLIGSHSSMGDGWWVS